MSDIKACIQCELLKSELVIAHYEIEIITTFRLNLPLKIALCAECLKERGKLEAYNAKKIHKDAVNSSSLFHIKR